ncbi:hypothetical protein [Vulcanisaeta distributa]|uniref:hypothetical protein n=1 Tax=Vulcanisaeta distributa TaxID=164451 RepID=UPI000A6FCEA1|nr:hypothetical protein [Vulcanisaeta distributa]
MLTNLSWNYVGKLHNDFLNNLKSINTLVFLLNRQRIKLRIALSTLDLILNLLGSVNPDFMPPHGEEYALITKDTVESLMRDYDVNKYVTIESMKGHGRTYIVTIKASPTLIIELMITCNNDCEYYVDDRVSIARSNADTYFQLILKASTIMSKVFETDMPRILLTHNPTIYGKIIPINRNEVIALSIWDLLRLNDVISRGETSR